jgi:hypothetical protein
MYILGNARLLCDKSDLWNEIVSNMEDGTNDVIGTTLGLHCDIHNVTTQVQWPVDFSEVKEGGCSKLCGTVLDCGHQVRLCVCVCVLMLIYLTKGRLFIVSFALPFL